MAVDVPLEGAAASYFASLPVEIFPHLFSFIDFKSLSSLVIRGFNPIRENSSGLFTTLCVSWGNRIDFHTETKVYLRIQWARQR